MRYRRTITGARPHHPSLPSSGSAAWLNRYRQVGRTSDGVPMVVGPWHRPPLWFCFGICASAASAILLTVFFVFIGIPPTDPLGLPPALTWGLVIALFGVSGILNLRTALWLLRTRGRTRRLAAADDMAERVGVEAEQIREFARERGIRPEYNINGEDYYDPAAFKDAAILLRPAESPDSAVLLRPASATHTEEEQLLRPTESGTGAG